MSISRSGFAALKNAIWGSLTTRVATSVSGNVVGSVGSVAGNVVGSVGSVTGSVGSVVAAVQVNANSDKTGYSLTAGSYSVRASSSQSGAITISGANFQTGACASVTDTRCILTNSFRGNSNGAGEIACTIEFSSAIVLTARKDISTNIGVARWHIAEFF